MSFSGCSRTDAQSVLGRVLTSTCCVSATAGTVSGCTWKGKLVASKSLHMLIIKLAVGERERVLPSSPGACHVDRTVSWEMARCNQRYFTSSVGIARKECH